jgi:Ca-activated chloride channel family protein
MFELEGILSVYQLEMGVPWALWLIPFPLFILLFPPMRYRTEALYVPFFSQVLAIKKEKPSKGVKVVSRQWYQVILMWLVWICLITSLASPQLVGEPQKQIKTARNLLLNVDLSLSMDSRDWISKEGERTTRWDAVKEVMDEFIQMREGDRMGLVLFASQAYLQAPFTSDLQVVRSLLDESEIGLAGAKTVIGNAIGKGIELFESDSIEERVMILVTDGADSGSDLPPQQAARMAAMDSITIYTIGIKEIYAILDELEPIEFEDEDYIPRRLLFFIPLMAAFGLTVLFHLLAGLVSTLRIILLRFKATG